MSAQTPHCDLWTADTGCAEEAAALGISPLDEHNAELLNAVRPRRWEDPVPLDVYDLVVVGAGAGGLVSAKQAARRGARSALISEHLAGGDCLNVGCVPSKALLRCARALREVRRASEFGVRLPAGAAPSVDFGAIMERMRRLRARIAPADSHVASADAGAHVFQGRATFVAPHELEVNGKRLRFRKAIVATGGRAAIPAIPGLESVPYLTNASLFNLTELPRRLVVLGAGAIALEMAQAFAAFGSIVTVVARSRVLSRSDAAAAAALQAALERDGVRFVSSALVESVGFADAAAAAAAAAADGRAPPPTLRVNVRHGEPPSLEVLECEALLIAMGRSPNLEAMGLEAAEVRHHGGGIEIDQLLRTSNGDVYAVGDCAAGVGRMTHVSGEMAKMAVENALFGGSWLLSSLLVPSCIYTEPEFASVGVEKGDEVDTYLSALAHNDRSILEGEADEGGFVQLHCVKGTSQIVGGCVLAPRAGDIINEISLAISAGVGVDHLARIIHPYPSTGEAVMQAALGFVRKHWQRLEHEPPQD